MTSVAFVASVARGEQLASDLDGPAQTASPVLSRHVQAGPARLLRKLVTIGLEVDALAAAAALVAAMDAEPACLTHASVEAVAA